MLCPREPPCSPCLRGFIGVPDGAPIARSLTIVFQITRARACPGHGVVKTEPAASAVLRQDDAGEMQRAADQDSRRAGLLHKIMQGGGD